MSGPLRVTLGPVSETQGGGSLLRLAHRNDRQRPKQVKSPLLARSEKVKIRK